MYKKKVILWLYSDTQTLNQPQKCVLYHYWAKTDYRLHHIPATCLWFSEENDILDHKVKREEHNPEILSLFLHMLTLLHVWKLIDNL